MTFGKHLVRAGAAKFSFPRLLLALLISFCLVSPVFVGPVQAEAVLVEGENAVRFDFIDADLRSFIQTVSELTGESFVIDPRVQGQITVVSPEPIPMESVIEVFESILATYAFTVISAGEVNRIVPTRTAKTERIPLGINQAIPRTGEERYITQIVFLNHVTATDLLVVLRPLLSETGTVFDHRETNALIITDTRQNVRKVIQLLQKLDTEQASEALTVYRLDYAVASRVSEVLTSLFGQTPSRRGQVGQPSTGFQVVPDDRTNQLFVVAPAHIQVQLEETIARLDEEAEISQSRIHVYFLENADAEDLATVLTDGDLLQDRNQGARQRRVVNPRAGATAEVASREQVFLEDIAITADPGTNSLVVRADPDQYAQLEPIIKQLDVPRQQVLVEALIAEVTEGGTRELGVEWRVFDEVDVAGKEYAGAGISTFDGANSAISQLSTPEGLITPPSGLVLGLVDGTINFGGQEIINISTLARAFQSSSNFNVLSTPHLLTTDNREAELVVGESRPFLQSDQLTAEGSTLRSFDYQDIGITLRLTPSISQGGRIRMDVYQEVTDFVDQVDVGAITTTKRSIDTRVTVDDGQTIIIGGLMRRTNRLNEGKVPCVGDLPLVGWLFKSASRQNDKTNLLVFITPHILTDSDAIDTKTQEKRDQLPEARQPGGLLDFEVFPQQNQENTDIDFDEALDETQDPAEETDEDATPEDDAA